jgi:O-acetyl-ADP-ribose deacetylase (regulator of RNase III)
MSKVLKEKQLLSGQRIQVAQGDLTAETVDAIVNAANEYLKHGGGVAGAIVQKGGRVIQEESVDWVRKNGPVSHAEPAYTSAGRLPCKYVIHAVGPVWGDGDEDHSLAAAVLGSLKLADQLELKSIAFPAISTGIFGFPKDRAARIIYRAFQDYFAQHPDSGLKVVRLTLFDQGTVETFLDVWSQETKE